MNTIDTPPLNRPPLPETGKPGSASPPVSRVQLGGWIVVVAFLTVVGLVAGLLPRMKHQRSLEEDTVTLSIPTVNVVSATPGHPLSSMLLPAEVRPFVEAPIYARASGYVTNWLVDIGAQVKMGQLLAVIDTPELDQQLEEAKAQLAQANANLSLAEITAKRWAELLKTASVSEQENAEKAADLQLKQANLEAAKAAVERIADLKSFSRVTAPFPGTVTARDIDVGDLINQGRELFRLSDTRTLRVFVRVPQSGTPGLAVGAKADILIPEMPGRKFAATVVRTAGAIDTSSRTLLLELDVDNSKGEIIAGSYAQVSFQDLNAIADLELPSNALLFRAEGTQVGIVEPDGKVVLRNILLGRDLGQNVEVLSGISATDKVIINPSDSLVTGAHVRIADASSGGVAVK